MTREIHTPATHPNHAVVGRRFRGPDGRAFYCDSWEEGRGYWMTSETDFSARRNVSERAIGSSFRRLSDDVPVHGCGHMQGRGAA